MHRVSFLLCSFLAGVLSLQSFAQQDVKGGKDHPLFPTRMPGYYLDQYKELEFDSYTFKARPKSFVVEGRKYYLSYRPQKAAERPSVLAVLRNYKSAFEKIGGAVVFEDGKSVVMKQKKGSNELWVEIWAAGQKSGCHWYKLNIVEKGEMKQVITANDMLDALNKDGFIALDIHFDTGKSTIKPESRSIIDQIVSLLKTNANIKISVEGHTDNVGDAASNKKLSDERATSVVTAIMESGIDGSRLSSIGYGQEKPVADNRTEEGRAKNRRVELVKK